MVRDARKSKAQEKAAGGSKSGQNTDPQQFGGRVFDGAPGSVSDSRGRPPSLSGLSSVGRSARSQSRMPSSMSAAFPIVERDPAREGSRYEKLINTRLDLPGNAYALIKHEKASLMPRRGFNNSATNKNVSVAINSHRVTKFPTRNIYQYDVSIGNGQEKRGLIQKVWASKTVSERIGRGVIFNGDKICWAPNDFGPDVRLQVDLDAEQGIPAREDRENKHIVLIRKAGLVNMQSLQSYLVGQCDFNNHVLMAINFMDHLLRETPSKQNVTIKRSFFSRMSKERASLGGGIEAMKGLYQSLRLAQGGKLVCNVDVSNTTFWNATSFLSVVQQLTGAFSIADITQKVKPQPAHPSGGFRESAGFGNLRRLRKNEFFVRHRGRAPNEEDRIWRVANISEKNARTYKFTMKERSTGKEYPDTSIEEYYKRRYDFGLSYPTHPVVECTKKGVVFPMEICYMSEGQRYPFKLDDKQTSAMIRFAVTKPPERAQAIQWGKENILKWQSDPYLSNYGLDIEYDMLKSNAKILKPPVIQFGGTGKDSTIMPGTSGRWDLRGKKFFGPNPAALKAWSVCIVGGGPSGVSTTEAKTFIADFIKIYRGHGGVVANLQPPIVLGSSDPAQSSMAAWQAAGNAVNMRPQILLFILPGKITEVYNRIKKSCDCRFGVVSQCVQAAHVKKNQAQYHSNVAMKVNAKLGGTTSRVIPSVGASFFSKPTMIIGADVSHAAPGLDAPSMAAMTMSMDKNACRYIAACQSNASHAEMIAERPIEDMMKPTLQEWATTVGAGALPQHVYYFRDGVSESQYHHVLDTEVARIRALMMKMSQCNKNYKVNFTVIVCEKRHHIRFFPPLGSAGADQNGNPLPGTLVERDVTHPFENDFYLCSHRALQGTARPTHYHVLTDEEGVPTEKLHAMIYEQCYQYMRSTTPVSLHPAVYYAHLASNRGRCHEDIAASAARDREEHGKSPIYGSEPAPLLPMPNEGRINYSMWYI